ncbi:MAG: hypothetical protein IT364_21165 [Candidatus Hydrogenedentes bacterium]|nr:hypothetical protein [Candidatus Hydrogenedentota bacterium]
MSGRPKYALALFTVIGLTAGYTELRDFNEIHDRYVQQEIKAIGLLYELEGLNYREDELQKRVEAMQLDLVETEAALRSLGRVRPGEKIYRIRPIHARQ